MQNTSDKMVREKANVLLDKTCSSLSSKRNVCADLNDIDSLGSAHAIANIESSESSTSSTTVNDSSAANVNEDMNEDDDLGFTSLPASYGEHNIVDNGPPVGMLSSSLIREKTVACMDGEPCCYVSPMTGWCRTRSAVAMKSLCNRAGHHAPVC
jgi:hypothetical protein